MAEPAVDLGTSRAGLQLLERPGSRGPSFSENGAHRGTGGSHIRTADREPPDGFRRCILPRPGDPEWLRGDLEIHAVSQLRGSSNTSLNYSPRKNRRRAEPVSAAAVETAFATSSWTFRLKTPDDVVLAQLLRAEERAMASPRPWSISG